MFIWFFGMYITAVLTAQETSLTAAGVSALEYHIPRVGLTRLGRVLSSDLEQESGSQRSWVVSLPLAMTHSCHQK